MDNVPNSQETTIEKSQLSLPTFVIRILKAGFTLLVFGGVLIILIKFDIAIPPHVDPTSLLGGAIVLIALTLIGVPLIPAAVAGVAVWAFIQSLFTTLL